MKVWIEGNINEKQTIAKRSQSEERDSHHNLRSHSSRSSDSYEKHHSRKSHYHSRSPSHHHHHHHSSHRRNRSRSRSRLRSKLRSESRSTSRTKNTLLDVINNAKQSIICISVSIILNVASRNSTIPDFDMIEPRYAYGKDLYVGNIDEGTFPEDVVAFLNRAMHTAHLNLWPGNPVLSCRVLPKFCFVSLRHEDEATAALNMDGIFFHGQRLRISFFFSKRLKDRPTGGLRRSTDEPSPMAGNLSG